MARRTKLNADLQAKIVQALEAGNYFDASCEYVGVSDRTGFKWLERGRAELMRRDKPSIKEGSKQWHMEEPFVQFLQVVSRATSKAEVGAVANIRQHGRDDWRADAWFLEHRMPQKWGKQVKEFTGKDGGTLKVEFVYPDVNTDD